MTSSLKVLIIAFGATVVALAGVAFADSQESSDILVLETKIRVPSAPLHGAWSANGRQIYFNQPWHGTLRVADLQKGEVLENPKSKHRAMAGVVSSPDGRFVAWGNAGEVRLLQASTLEDVARLDRDLNDCSFQEKYAMQFTSDSRFLWISCGYIVKKVASYTAAVKIQIPEMKVVDRLTLTSPQPGESFSTQLSQIRKDGDNIQLISRVSVSTPYPEDRQPPGGSYQLHYFYYGYDLGSKTELFPPINLDALGFEEHSTTWETYFSNDKTLVINIAGGGHSKILVVESPKGTIFNQLEKEHFQLPYRMLNAPDGKYLFGGTSHAKPAKPGEPQSLGSLLVFEPKTLKLLQETYTGRV